MKKIYEFTVPKEEEITKSEEQINEQGEKVITEKKEKIKKSYKFFIRKPTRSMVDAADLHYGIVMADGVKRGLLTSAQLYKRFLNDGGILSEPEKESLENARKRLIELQMEFQKLNINTQRTTTDEEKLRDVLTEIGEIRNSLQRLELQQSALFDQTAENRARNQAILWYVLYLSYMVDNETGVETEIFPSNKEVEVFSQKDFETRLSIYDSIEESEDQHMKNVIKKIFYFISFWYTGRAVTSEDFKQIDEISDTIE